jgi:hypothetical protein
MWEPALDADSSAVCWLLHEGNTRRRKPEGRGNRQSGSASCDRSLRLSRLRMLTTAAVGGQLLDSDDGTDDQCEAFREFHLGPGSLLFACDRQSG